MHDLPKVTASEGRGPLVSFPSLVTLNLSPACWPPLTIEYSLPFPHGLCPSHSAPAATNALSHTDAYESHAHPSGTSVKPASEKPFRVPTSPVSSSWSHTLFGPSSPSPICICTSHPRTLGGRSQVVSRRGWFEDGRGADGKQAELVRGVEYFWGVGGGNI